MGNSGDLGLAGLLHDIGLANVPPEILEVPEEERTPEEQAEYEKHPEHAINLIQSRKLVISGLIHRIIIQHHERYNGTGYPKNLSGQKICTEAQILAIADRFDELTALVEGKPRLSPLEAIMELKKCISTNPSECEFDPVLFENIMKLFPKDENEAAEIQSK
jgi:HD-GYP domain-containing protein (c-di-GMP phosphodiesterase class II)